MPVSSGIGELLSLCHERVCILQLLIKCPVHQLRTVLLATAPESCTVALAICHIENGFGVDHPKTGLSRTADDQELAYFDLALVNVYIIAYRPQILD